MSYQVLARKWRPSTFEQMVGQAHVLRALVNALDQQRLHHAYLFTGTRGVGKTTIARLLAKSLNCEIGVSSKPCGVCSSCTEIAEGRFVDLIEVDAASRTKVEDTRELLENVQYAPTRGRFKVYLIDEVHMLSTSSFNALLKTLEEPPPHVKFLLATTDPQKLPVTVLSRCLQFNLKNMSREHIVQHLSHILAVEKVPFDDPSLWAIAEGAQGSMRDALSLTDQAIAFGQGQLKEQEVASMLGTVDLKRVLKLVLALFEKNVDQLMALVAEIDEHSPDYQALMTEMMSTLHRVAIAQAAPNAIDNAKGDKDAIVTLAGATYAEDVHLYYQIAAKAKPEMAFAPSERAGFEMALLRMLAFSQTPAADVGALPELTSKPYIKDSTAANSPKTMEPQRTNEAPVLERSNTSEQVDPVLDTVEVGDHDEAVASESVSMNSQLEAEAGFAAPVQVEPELEEQSEEEPEQPFSESGADCGISEIDPISEIEPNSEPEINTQVVLVDAPKAVLVEQSENTDIGEVFDEDDLLRPARWPHTDRETNPEFWWQVTLHRLGLAGMTKTLFAHSQWRGFDGQSISVTISPNYRKIMNESHQQYLLNALQSWLPGCTMLAYEFGAAENTPQLWAERLIQKANRQAYQYLQQDPFVENLIKEFNGQIQQETAVPNHNPIPSGV